MCCCALLRCTCVDYACVARLRDARTHTTVPRSAGKGLGGSLLQLANNIDRCVTEGEGHVLVCWGVGVVLTKP